MTTSMLDVGQAFVFSVTGTPITQGSPKIGRHGGRPVILHQHDVALDAWRTLIMYEAKARARRAGWRRAEPGEPVRLVLDFYLRQAPSNRRPKPAQKPDLDKLVRAVFDALTMADVYVDDAQVVELVTRKHWAWLRAPGAEIRVEVLS